MFITLTQVHLIDLKILYIFITNMKNFKIEIILSPQEDSILDISFLAAGDG